MTIIGGFNMGKFTEKRGMGSVHDKGTFQAGLKFNKLDKLAQKETVDLSKSENRLLNSAYVLRNKFHEKRGKNIFKQGPAYNTVSINPSSSNAKVDVRPQTRMNIKVENIMGMQSNRGVFSQKAVNKGLSNFYSELKKQDMDNKIFAKKDISGKITGIGIKNNSTVENYRFNKNKLEFRQKINTPVPTIPTHTTGRLLSPEKQKSWDEKIKNSQKNEIKRNLIVHGRKPFQGGIGGIAPEHREAYLAKFKTPKVDFFRRDRSKRYFNPYTGEDI